MDQKTFYTQDKVQRINKILNINGSKYLFNSNLTILELIDYLGFNKSVIVIDYNGVILEKKFWKCVRKLLTKELRYRILCKTALSWVKYQSLLAMIHLMRMVFEQ